MSTELDLVIRNADVVTASDRFTCDIGVRDGRIAVLGHGLPRGARELDASGLESIGAQLLQYRFELWPKPELQAAVLGIRSEGHVSRFGARGARILRKR